MNLPMHSDEELVDIFRQDRESVEGKAALDLIVARYHAKLVQVLIPKFRGDRGAAEDVAQETFIKIVAYIGTFDVLKATFQKWFFWVAINVYRDELRRKKCRKAVTNWHEATFDRPDGCQPEAEVAAQIKEHTEILWAAINQLSPEQRQAVCLVFVDGLSYREAQERTGIYYSTIAYRVQAALPLLRDALDGIPAEFSGFADIRAKFLAA